MKQRINKPVLLFFVLLFLSNCSTDTKVTPKPEKDSIIAKPGQYHHPDRNVFMWEVRSANSKVYILGSIHVSKGDIYPLDPRIENAFTEATEFVSEVDMSKANLSFLAEKAMYKDGTTLKDHLPKEIYNRLVTNLEQLGITETVYGKLKPGFALLTFIGMKLQEAGFKTDQGIDIYFAKRTKDEKKNVHELESVEFQMNLFNEGLDKYMNEFIDYSLEDIKNLSQNIGDLFDAWSVGDTASIDSMLTKGLSQTKNIKKILIMFIDDRNIKMTEKIEGYLTTGKTFFIVAGAGHMTGENGIISLLSKKGIYKIKQL